MYEIDQFGNQVWDWPLPLYAPNDPIAYDREDEPRLVFNTFNAAVDYDDDIYDDDIPF